ncbi:MAG: 8-amino-7-oxononanoate synthase [Gemmatimonadaceae bacterium]|nr:8-amino-7-oxononanoate synthase [Gemmatimonadaceae bacterium]
MTQLASDSSLSSSTSAPSSELQAQPLDAALGRELDVLRRAGLLRYLRRVEQRRGAEIVLEGKPAVDFSSNDYLGLATDARIAAAVADALQRDATGAAAARSIAGNHPLHEALEAALARLKGADAALLFPTGFAANAGAIPALAGRGDVIYSDALNHASIIDGCRLSRATTRTFPHADLDALAALLDEDRGKYRRRLIVVEGVYSMDGDLFPLQRLVPLAREHGAWIYVDDAHATGVLGATGAGSAEHCGVLHEIDIAMGTLGKALGTVGAFIAGTRTLREFLINRARSFVFTTGTPPALAAGAIAALDIMAREPWRRARLAENCARVRAGLAALGHEAPANQPGHIVPVIIGGAEATLRVGQELRERGLLVGAVRPPTVPMGSARLRITVSAAHTAEQIDRLLEALAAARPPRAAA